MMFRPSQRPFLVGHSVTFRKQAPADIPFLDEQGKRISKTQPTWLWAPLDGLPSRKYIRVQVAHFFIVTASSWLAIFASLMIGAAFGDVTGITPPAIGIYALLVGLGHVIPLYIAFNLRTWDRYDVRINPWITLFECVGHQRIGLVSCVVELIGQALGAVIASAWVTGILSDSPLFRAGIGSSVENTALGWACALEIIAGFFMGWVYFHQWYHDDSLSMPLTMSYVVSGMTMVVYPFLGSTTHNPFRFWAAAIIEGTAGQRGWWVFVFAPGIGVMLGYLFHTITWKVRDY